MIYVLALLLLFTIGSLIFYMRTDSEEKGEAKASNKTLKAENEALSNRPLTDADLIARLRDRAANEREDKRHS